MSHESTATPPSPEPSQPPPPSPTSSRLRLSMSAKPASQYLRHRLGSGTKSRISVSSLSHHLPGVSRKIASKSDDVLAHSVSAEEEAVVDDEDADGEDGDNDDNGKPDLMTQTLAGPTTRGFTGRGRRPSSSAKHRRSTSVDVAQATGLGTSIFSFISAASKARYNRMATSGDDDEHETEDPEVDEDDLDDEVFDDDGSSGTSIVVTDSEGKAFASDMRESGGLPSRPNLPLASSFLLNRASNSVDEYVNYPHSPLEPIKSVGSLLTLNATRSESSSHDDESASVITQNSTESLRSSALAEKLRNVFGYAQQEEVLHGKNCCCMRKN